MPREKSRTATMEVSVELDQKDKTFLAGQRVTGEAIVSVKKSGKTKSIQLRCVGLVTTNSSVINLARAARNPSQVSVPNLLFHREIVVWGKGSKDGDTSSQPMPKGTVAFPFEFDLKRQGGFPELALPSTFQSRHLSIVYFVQVEVIRAWPQKNCGGLHRFNVAARIDVGAPLYRQPKSVTASTKVGIMGFFQRGNIEATTSIPYTGFCKGDHVPIRLQLHHAGSIKHISGMQITLIQNTRVNRPLKSSDPNEVVIPGSRVKTRRIREVLEPLNIAPGQTDVDLTVNYYICPHGIPLPKKEGAATLLRSNRSQALEHSDRMRWSTNRANDEPVTISHELEIQLILGQSKSFGIGKEKEVVQSLAIADQDISDIDKRSTIVSDVLQSFTDGILSGGTQFMTLSLPITVGTVSTAPATPPPVASSPPAMPVASPPVAHQQPTTFQSQAIDSNHELPPDFSSVAGSSTFDVRAAEEYLKAGMEPDSPGQPSHSQHQRPPQIRVQPPTVHKEKSDTGSTLTPRTPAPASAPILDSEELDKTGQIVAPPCIPRSAPPATWASSNVTPSAPLSGPRPPPWAPVTMSVTPLPIDYINPDIRGKPLPLTPHQDSLVPVSPIDVGTPLDNHAANAAEYYDFDIAESYNEEGAQQSGSGTPSEGFSFAEQREWINRPMNATSPILEQSRVVHSPPAEDESPTSASTFTFEEQSRWINASPLAQQASHSTPPATHTSDPSFPLASDFYKEKLRLAQSLEQAHPSNAGVLSSHPERPSDDLGRRFPTLNGLPPPPYTEL
ncbi:hypothetical protein DFS34DRAFT_624898 [Phlyctochytrium arcticum]|nr:hypothetical protein DFS34DRAFT_624898 [Phlyctochytrium arcticum]